MEASSFSAEGMLASAAAQNLTEVGLNFKQVNGVNDYKIETAHFYKRWHWDRSVKRNHQSFF